MEFTDIKLDSYLTNMKESTSDTDVLLNYKKAVRRLDALKEQHNSLVKHLTDPSSDSSKESESSDTSERSESEDIQSMSIDALIAALAEIKRSLEMESTDMQNLIKMYVRYKKIALALKSKQSEIQNRFNRVDANRGNVVVTKINLESIC